MPEGHSLLGVDLLNHLRAVVAMPAWVLAAAHGLSLRQARRLQAAVRELLVTVGAVR